MKKKEKEMRSIKKKMELKVSFYSKVIGEFLEESAMSHMGAGQLFRHNIVQLLMHLKS